MEPVHQGQDSGRGERSWLLEEKEYIKQEKGGDGASGGKDKREGAHLNIFPNKIKSPDWSFRAGRWSSL